MNNVHGFRDINQNNNQRGNYQNLNNNINDNIPFINNFQSQRQPLQETIPYTLKLICFPSLKLYSLSVILSVLMILIYTICCFSGITKIHQQVLEVETEILINFGAMQDILLKKGQIYRLITASFLHKNLLHIVMNLVSLVFLLSRLQKIYNIKILGGILVGSSASGYMLSALCNPSTTISAGSSTLILGLIGTYIGFMTINWKTLASNRQMRSQLCCMIGILVFFSLLFSFGPDIDTYGHLGGMLGGFLMTLSILPAIQNKSNFFTLFGIIGYAGCMLLLLVLFYFVV